MKLLSGIDFRDLTHHRSVTLASWKLNHTKFFDDYFSSNYVEQMTKEIASAQCVLEKLKGYALINKFKGKSSKEGYVRDVNVNFQDPGLVIEILESKIR